MKASDTVGSLKAKIQEIDSKFHIFARNKLISQTLFLDISVERQRLILPPTYRTLREDGQTLAHYNVSNGATIYLLPQVGPRSNRPSETGNNQPIQFFSNFQSLSNSNLINRNT